MSVWRRQYRTDRRLWLGCTVVAFGVFGALLPIQFVGGEVVFWELFWLLFQHADELMAWALIGLTLLIWGIPLAVVAAAWGWVGQAIVRVIWPRVAQPDRATADSKFGQ